MRRVVRETMLPNAYLDDVQLPFRIDGPAPRYIEFAIDWRTVARLAVRAAFCAGLVLLALAWGLTLTGGQP